MPSDPSDMNNGSHINGSAGDGSAHPNPITDGSPSPRHNRAEAGGNGVPTSPMREDANSMTVVGIGASAGGVHALQAFFRHASPDSGAAFVVVLHLSPEHESHLAEVLSRTTVMPVRQVMEAVHLEPNHVYVIPPAKHLFMEDSMLRLGEIEQLLGQRVAVDRFFRTLAESRGPQAIAVILSGAGMDGSLGLKRVKEEGGLVIVQDPIDAEYDGMPRSAIATGMVDYTLPATEIARQIEDYWSVSRRMHLPQEAAPSPEQRDEGLIPEIALRDILTHIRLQTGHDFAHYKRATILRRIARRLQVSQLLDLPTYLDYLRRHPAEVGDLVNDLLISVTQFFRDTGAWETLAREVLPRLTHEKDRNNDEVRAWVCGCATGEEAYSLAILLLEHAATMERPPRVLIFATDMDEDAITYAREGSYPEAIIADVSEERLRRWFFRENGRYRVRKEVRETVLFAYHNVLRDTPFSRLDLITCRNLLIYLNRQAQESVFDTFHFALRPDGRLMLGSAEVVDGTSTLFSPTDKQHRLYVRRPISRATPPLPAPVPPAGYLNSAGITRRGDSAFGTGPREPAPNALASTAPDALLPLAPFPDRPVTALDLHRSLLELYAPPSILINESHQIMHLSNGAARYLRFVAGEPTTNLLRVVQPELRLEVSTALYAAVSEGVDQYRVAHVHGVDGTLVPLRIAVRPLQQPDVAKGYMLVMFDIRDDTPLPAPVNAPVVPIVSDLSETTSRLEDEIFRLQTQLHSNVEQYEGSVEQLKASNEELQAMNEELRSATEELETSKEELQSINEELTTVNQELKSRVEEVNRSNSDLQNLFTATDIATIFLDRELCIKRFTPSVEALFNLIPTDLGRPLTHLTHKLDYDQLLPDTESVLRRLIPIEREVSGRDGRFFLARLLPYRTPEDRIEGVVVTFMDITERKRSEEKERQADERFRAIVNQATNGVAQFDLTGSYLMVNRYYADLLGYNEAELLQMSLRDVTPPDDYALVHRAMEQLTQGGTPFQIEKRYVRKDGSNLWAFASVNAIRDRAGNPESIVAVVLDITERKKAEEALRRSQERLQRAISIKQLGICFLNDKDRFTDANDAFLQLCAMSRAELIDSGITWHTITPPEWQERTRQAMDELRTTGRTTPYEKELVRKDGTRFWGLFVASRLSDHEMVEYVIDITDRKRAEEALRGSEERFRTVADLIPDLLWSNDQAGETDWYNRRWREYTGQSQEEAVDSEWLDTVHPDDQEASRARFQAAIASGTPLEEERRMRRASDGTYRWFLVRAQPVRDETGTITRWFGTATDIHEQKTAREALETSVAERTQELAQLNELRKELLRQLVAAQEDEAARISRDLHDDTGQQITAMLLGLRNLKNRPSVTEDAVAQKTLTQVEHLAGEVAQKAHRLSFTLRPTALDDLGLVEALRTYTDEWSRWSDLPVDYISVGFDGGRLPREIESTIYRITQEALTNILKHATGEHGATQVNVTLRRTSREVVTIVEDNGPGFDIDGMRSTAAGKRRLGLFGMQERASLVGGSVTVESTPREGTSIDLHIPLG